MIQSISRQSPSLQDIAQPIISLYHVRILSLPVTSLVSALHPLLLKRSPLYYLYLTEDGTATWTHFSSVALSAAGLSLTTYADGALKPSPPAGQTSSALVSLQPAAGIPSLPFPSFPRAPAYDAD